MLKKTLQIVNVVFKLTAFFCIFVVLILIHKIQTNPQLIVTSPIINVEYAGIVALILSLFFMLLVYLLGYRQIYLTIIANSMLVPIITYLNNILKSEADDWGMILKTKFVTVTYEYNLQEKSVWIIRLQEKYTQKLPEIPLENLTSFNAYQEKILEELNKLVVSIHPTLSEKVSNLLLGDDTTAILISFIGGLIATWIITWLIADFVIRNIDKKAGTPYINSEVNSDTNSDITSDTNSEINYETNSQANPFEPTTLREELLRTTSFTEDEIDTFLSLF